jgi:hypothetical protein
MFGGKTLEKTLGALGQSLATYFALNMVVGTSTNEHSSSSDYNSSRGGGGRAGAAVGMVVAAAMRGSVGSYSNSTCSISISKGSSRSRGTTCPPPPIPPFFAFYLFII